MTNKVKNKQKTKNIIFKVSPVELTITPFFMAKISEDLHRELQRHIDQKNEFH